MVQRHSQGGSTYLRAYIVVCSQTHCNPSSFLFNGLCNAPMFF